MTPRAVEKVKTVSDFFYRDRILLRAMLQDELLEEQEGSFMRNFLSDLHECFPGIFSC